ncbi:MAG: hypothetical protein G01um101418_809 [Parcubacteria group bacterium Gr01-1014_18]|nr:MAG: hypothetical protein Greene041636_691 [Parcubacteria group bacterium Greene0416_36]TSC80111.1 MAG: hypothetical protein G01um101418_809 [Parcubacteria group bacterium Gr01-1014_18]TSC98599.1 MAG: hypothetical protein Greene101420_651 [Parcubacteria group bacterium Greene1014_20]TSD06426.1 MAG: hypothetical protein Greene07142_917 [Parcubacteria group bacterium Greene0714_2]
MKSIAISIILTILFVGGASFLLREGDSNSANIKDPQSNISIVDGKQIIEVTAKGGYSPRNMVAKANMPTVLKMKTNGTFDCSSAFTIPSLGYRKNLPASGETLINVPPQKEGSTLRGLCSMGMYHFAVDFNL